MSSPSLHIFSDSKGKCLWQVGCFCSALEVVAWKQRLQSTGLINVHEYVKLIWQVPAC